MAGGKHDGNPRHGFLTCSPQDAIPLCLVVRDLLRRGHLREIDVPIARHFFARVSRGDRHIAPRVLLLLASTLAIFAARGFAYFAACGFALAAQGEREAASGEVREAASGDWGEREAASGEDREAASGDWGGTLITAPVPP